MRIDLHAHTTASDGTFDPAAFARHASTVVDVVAITDHDTVDGIDAAVAAGADVEIVPGIELSTSREGRKLHILGLGIDHRDERLGSQLQGMRRDRADRAERMVERLRQMGYQITMADVLAQAGSAVIARPHVARALVERGLVRTIQDAFAPGLLADGGEADVRRSGELDPVAAIALVHQTGGRAVLAHPGLARGRTTPVPDALIRDLAASGLDGLEVDHPEHGRATRARLRKLARELGLVMTGGSDCHGPGAPGGPRLGGWLTSEEALAKLRG